MQREQKSLLEGAVLPLTEEGTCRQQVQSGTMLQYIGRLCSLVQCYHQMIDISWPDCYFQKQRRGNALAASRAVQEVTQDLPMVQSAMDICQCQAPSWMQGSNKSDHARLPSLKGWSHVPSLLSLFNQNWQHPRGHTQGAKPKGEGATDVCDKKGECAPGKRCVYGSCGCSQISQILRV